MALIKGHRKWDPWIVLTGWIIPTAIIAPIFYGKMSTFNYYVLLAMTMTLTTNCLTMWMALVLNSDEHLEKMKTHMEKFPKFEKRVSKFIKRAGKSLKPVEEALQDPVAVVREHKAEILAELFPDEEEELDAIPLALEVDSPPLLTIMPRGEEKY